MTCLPQEPLGIHLPATRVFGLALPEVRLNPGDTLLVRGPNGAGKTTLLRLLCQGLDERVRGQWWVQRNGATVSLKPEDVRARTLFIPDVPAYHFLTQTPEAELAFFRAKYPPQEPIPEPLRPLLELPEEVRQRPVHELSRGWQKRAYLAARFLRFLNAQHFPGLVCWDEPAASLDDHHLDLVLEALRYLSDHRVTLVVAAHHPRICRFLEEQSARILRLGGDASCPICASD